MLVSSKVKTVSTIWKENQKKKTFGLYVNPNTPWGLLGEWKRESCWSLGGITNHNGHKLCEQLLFQLCERKKTQPSGQQAHTRRMDVCTFKNMFTIRALPTSEQWHPNTEPILNKIWKNSQLAVMESGKSTLVPSSDLLLLVPFHVLFWTDSEVQNICVKWTSWRCFSYHPRGLHSLIFN